MDCFERSHCTPKLWDPICDRRVCRSALSSLRRSGRVRACESGSSRTKSVRENVVLRGEQVWRPPTPGATSDTQTNSAYRRSWKALGFRQIGVVREEYAVSPNGMKMFSVRDLTSRFQSCRFAIGLTISHAAVDHGANYRSLSRAVESGGGLSGSEDPRMLSTRPQFHRTDQKLRVHVFLCVTAYLLVTLLHRRARLKRAYEEVLAGSWRSCVRSALLPADRHD